MTNEELKRLAEFAKAESDDFYPGQQQTDYKKIADILTTLAMVSADEPEQPKIDYGNFSFYKGIRQLTDAAWIQYHADKLDHWRNKAMQLALDVEAWKALAENCQESQRGYKEENERLRQQLERAQKYQPIVDVFFSHIDSMNDLCEPDFTAEKVLKRFLNDVNPVLSRMHMERRAAIKDKS